MTRRKIWAVRAEVRRITRKAMRRGYYRDVALIRAVGFAERGRMDKDRFLAAEKSLSAAAEKQIKLYKPIVLERVANRFKDLGEAEDWFDSGRISGYGDLSPADLVRQGHADWVVEAIDAINAGVFA